MTVKKCELCGMFYDEDKFSECPFCSEKEKSDEKSKVTENRERRENPTKETATMVIGEEMIQSVINQEKSNDEKIIQLDDDVNLFGLNSIDFELQKMKPIEKRDRPSDDSKTQGFFGDKSPVVGWLVALKGPHVGSSFEIHEGKNSIGRGFQLDIPLSQDTKISRTACVYIVFDRKSFKFYLMPGDSNMLAYYDDAPILQPIQMINKTTLLLGETQLILVQFCDKDYNWEDYIRG